MVDQDQSSETTGPADAESLDQAMRFHDYYFQERKFLDETVYDVSKGFDKYLITLASGAIGFTLLFMEKVAPHPKAGTAGWLLATLVFFGVSLCVTLISFYCSQSSWERQRDILDRDQRLRYRQPVDDLPRLFTGVGAWLGEDHPWTAPLRRLGKQVNPWNTVTRMLNKVSLFAFFAGVFVLIVFCYSNLPSGGSKP